MTTQWFLRMLLIFLFGFIFGRLVFGETNAEAVQKDAQRRYEEYVAGGGKPFAPRTNPSAFQPVNPPPAPASSTVVVPVPVVVSPYIPPLMPRQYYWPARPYGRQAARQGYYDGYNDSWYNAWYQQW